MSGINYASFGIVLLVGLWCSPLAEETEVSFSAHMIVHMFVIAAASPLIAAGAVRHFSQVAKKLSGFTAMPLLASFLDVVVVWGWHTPALHTFARTETTGFLLEQFSFLVAGLLLWGPVFAGMCTKNLAMGLSGAAALLFTSMHMSLLGVLISVAESPICRVSPGTESSLLAQLRDQQIGGMLMLCIGGFVFLLGGLSLVAMVLKPSSGKG